MMEANQEQIDLAFRNSYEVIINNADASDIIAESGYFIHHPARPIDKQTIEDMIHYFGESDEFEKCIALKKYIDDRE